MQSNEAQHYEYAAQIWLEYFNKRLREENIISEAEYFRMANLIYARYPERKK